MYLNKIFYLNAQTASKVEPVRMHSHLPPRITSQRRISDWFLTMPSKTAWDGGKTKKYTHARSTEVTALTECY